MKIEMTFECNQDWEQMKVSGHGRHCELCCMTVYDFTGKSNSEIIKSGTGDLCGMFLAEQIETDLKAIAVPFSLKKTMLTIGTVLGLELNQVQGQDIDKGTKTEHVTKDLTETDSVAVNTGISVDPGKNGSDGCEKAIRPIKKKLYFSKRFPFIVKRRVRTVGRFRH